jgi:hypothetical protein
MPLIEGASKITLNKDAYGLTLGAGSGKEDKGFVTIGKVTELYYDKNNIICPVF